MFTLNTDLVSRLNTETSKMPAASFTLLLNQAITQWLDDPTLEYFATCDLKAPIADCELTERSANVSIKLINRIEQIKAVMPGLNKTLVVNLALWKWVNNPKITIPDEADIDKAIDNFLVKNSDLMNRLADFKQ